MLYVAFRDTLLRSRPGGDLRPGENVEHRGGVLNRFPQDDIAVAAIHLAGRGEFEAAAEQPGADLTAHQNDYERVRLMSGASIRVYRWWWKNDASAATAVVDGKTRRGDGPEALEGC